MILVDTSVWIDHFRENDAALSVLLEDGDVLVHPFVIGELACGHLDDRDEVLAAMRDLPTVPVARHDDVLVFIEARQLMGAGLGIVDVHLLASLQLVSGVTLLTNDRRLKLAAERLARAPRWH